MSSYAEALKQFYDGEVLGETVYSAMYAAATNPAEKRKWATLLQLETETKAWLRPHLVAQGVGVEEHTADRNRAIEIARPYVAMSWDRQMQGMVDEVGQFVATYQSFADEAEARGEAKAAAVCRHMVEHEKAQVAFARRELAGDTATSLEVITPLLKYPI